MGALEEAKNHLKKAREFLEAAQATCDLNLYDAAASNAVIAGINSKDAICLKVVGRTDKSENHNAALNELSRSGPDGKSVAPIFSRLLALKPKAQYAPGSVSAAEAKRAVEWAELLYEKAHSVVGN
jgi:uncharacterized protein (UPF0332 family)